MRAAVDFPDRRYRLFGFSVAGDFPLTASLLQSSDPIDLIISRSEQPLNPEELESSPVYASALRDQNGESVGRLYEKPEGAVFHFREGDFRVGADVIQAYLPEPASGLAALRLLGPVLSYWLELRGLPTLHASAVSVDSRAIVFASRHGGGKSGLAASLMKAGASLLADDMAVLEERDSRWEVRPAYPLMRMWPDAAEHFLGHYSDLPLVQRDSEKRSVKVGENGYGKFQEASSPLACIYLAARMEGTDAVEIQRISRSEALIELIRHSFSPRLVEAVGLQPARLDRLARLVQNVPVRRLVYPSGFERLEEVACRIVKFGGTP
jgi:hypothetical protein